MLKVLIDNNLSPLLAKNLCDLGFDAVHVREYQMQRASDEEIFLRASEEERVIVSADTDFGFILARWKREKPSLILFRRFPSRKEIQLKALQLVITKFETELQEGHILVVESARVRIRKLPLL